jgi:hypothetical protein
MNINRYIPDLPQPYRRMAEYLKSDNDSNYLGFAFNWHETSQEFWNAVDDGLRPKITKKIKSFFPEGFNFSEHEPIINYRLFHIESKGAIELLATAFTLDQALRIREVASHPERIIILPTY